MIGAKLHYHVITILLYLYFALAAFGQTTTVTGTVRDTTFTPIVSGKISFQFFPGSDATISGSSRFAMSQTNCAINQPQIATISRAANVVTATLTSTPAQTFSTGDLVNVTGVTDSTYNGTGFTLTGVSGGGVTLTWSQTAGNSSSSGGFVGGVMGKNGTGVCTLATNTALQPPGSYYIATVYAAGVKTSQFNFPTYLASQDISATVPTPATAPFQSFVDVISNQTIGGNKNFTGNPTFSGNPSFVNLAVLNTLTVNNVKQGAGAQFSLFDPLGVSHLSISSSSPYTNTLIQGNGAGSVLLGSAGKTSVADATGVITMSGSTSGTTALQPSAVAGSTTATLPANTGTVAETNLAQTWTATQTFTAPAISDPTIGGNTNLKRIKANQGSALVVGDVGSLSGGWGTTASVASVSGNDVIGQINILSNGTGQNINATFTLTFHDGTWTTAPLCLVVRSDGNNPTGAMIPNAMTATSATFFFNATPVAGTTYTATFMCVGR